MEFIIEIIFGVVMGFFGAGIRWIFFRKKRTFNALINEADDVNSFIGTAVFVAIVVSIALVDFTG